MISMSISIKPVGYPSMEDFTRRFHRLHAIMDVDAKVELVTETAKKLTDYMKSNVAAMFGFGRLYNNIRADAVDNSTIEVSAPGSDEYWMALEKGAVKHYVPTVSVERGEHKPKGVRIDLEGLGLVRIGNKAHNFVRNAIDDLQDDMGLISEEIFDMSLRQVGLL